jgi:hypothetical protein
MKVINGIEIIAKSLSMQNVHDKGWHKPVDGTGSWEQPTDLWPLGKPQWVTWHTRI